MSNEDIVAAVQNGHTELLEQLWDNVKRLIHIAAYRYYKATEGRGGVTVEDLEQVGYLALVDAVPRYDPDKAAFSTFLMEYLRKHFQEASGRLYEDVNGHRRPKDALNSSISLNIPVDEDGETELMEITEDPAANMDAVENRLWREQLHEIVAGVLQELPKEQIDVMRCRFWDGLTYEETAARLEYSTNTVRGAERKAIRTLRQPTHRKLLLPFYDFDFYSGTGLGSFKSSGSSVQERYVIRQERVAKKGS